ncbi:hypothetical protein [Altererythrobacter lutimaris]|nr:hypothetical protein [Altererythrobacter lutimaris]
MQALANILVVLTFRQSTGEATRLSDLSSVTGLPQKEALRLVRDLHDARVLTIRADAHEVTESEVCLDGDALHCLRDLLPISARIAFGE